MRRSCSRSRLKVDVGFAVMRSYGWSCVRDRVLEPANVSAPAQAVPLELSPYILVWRVRWPDVDVRAEILAKGESRTSRTVSAGSRRRQLDGARSGHRPPYRPWRALRVWRERCTGVRSVWNDIAFLRLAGQCREDERIEHDKVSAGDHGDAISSPRCGQSASPRPTCTPRFGARACRVSRKPTRSYSNPMAAFR